MRDRMRKERHLYFHAPMLPNPYSSHSDSLDVDQADTFRPQDEWYLMLRLKRGILQL